MICCVTCSVAFVVDVQIMQLGLRDVDNYQPIVCIEVVVVLYVVG